MKYKVMKLLCMFDLPMNDKKEQRAYRKFRKSLIQQGFFMMQFSTYVKTCANRESVEAAKIKVIAAAPQYGNIRLLEVTENQYDNIKIVVGTKSLREKLGEANGLIVL